MLKFIDKHPFIAGVMAGVIGVRIVDKKIKRLVRGIIILEVDKLDATYNKPPFRYSKCHKSEERSSTETDKDTTKEN